MAVIREDVVQISYEIFDNPFSKMNSEMSSFTKNINSSVKPVTTAFDNLGTSTNNWYSHLKGVSSEAGNVTEKLSGISRSFANTSYKMLFDISDGEQKINSLKSKISTVFSSIKPNNLFENMSNQLTSLKGQIGLVSGALKTAAKINFNGLKTGLSDVKTTLTQGQSGAKGFKTVLSNIGKITYSKLTNDISLIKTNLTNGSSGAKSFKSALHEAASVSFGKVSEGISSVTSKLSAGVNAAKKFTDSISNSLSNASNSITSKIFNIKNAIAGVVGGMAAKSSVNLVADRQDITSQFKILLGSAEAAKERVDDLTNFAGETPFTRDEIFAASKQLQVFTGNALSTGNSLRVIGDVAAGTGQSFQDVALWTGRLYDSMKSGKAVGEMTSRLQEMGAITGEDRRKIEELASAGGDITTRWTEVESIFSRYSGTMEELSGNTGNMITSLKSFVSNSLLLPLGNGIVAGLQPAIQKFREFRKSNKADIDAMGEVITTFVSKICVPLFSKIETAVEKVIVIVGSLKNGFSGLSNNSSGLSKVFSVIQPAFNFIISNKDTIISGIQGIAMAIGGILVANKIFELAKAFSALCSPIGLVVGIATLMFMVFKNGVEPVRSFFSELVQKIKGMAPTIIVEIQNFMNTFGSLLPQVLPIIAEVLTKIPPIIASMFPTIVEIGCDLILNLVQGLAQSMPILIDGAFQAISGWITAIFSSLPTVLSCGAQIINTLLNGIIQSIPNFVSGVKNVMTSFMQGISKNLPNIVQSGVQLIISLVGGLIKAIPQLLLAIPKIVKALWDGLTSINWLELGWNIIKGIGKGIVNGFKSLFGLGEEAGKTTNDGFNSGIISSSGTVFDTASNVSNNTATAFSNSKVASRRSGVDLTSAFSSGIVQNSPVAESAAFGVSTNTANAFNLGTDTSAFGSNMTNNFANGLTSATENPVQQAQSISKEVQTALEQAKVTIVNVSSEIISKLDELKIKITDTMLACQVSIQENMAESFTSLQTALYGTTIAFNNFETSATNALTSLSVGAVTGIVSFINVISNGILTAKQTVLTGINAIVTGTKTGVSQFNTIINTGSSNAITSVKNCASGIYSVFKGINLTDTGEQIMNGLIKGMNNKKSDVINLAKDIAKSISNTINRSLDIHSPSRLTTYSGEMTGMGLITGMENKIPDIRNTAKQLSDEIEYETRYKPTKESFINSTPVTQDIDNSINPIFNLTIENSNSVDSDRELARKVKKYIKEALKEMNESMSRKVIRMQNI